MRGRPEHQEQAAFVSLLAIAAGSGMWWCSIPNERPPGGRRDPKRAAAAMATLKARGLCPGAPDLMVTWQVAELHPFTAFVEFKAPRGRLSPEQRQVHDTLRTIGASVIVATSATGALTNLEQLGAPLRRVWRRGELVHRETAE